MIIDFHTHIFPDKIAKTVIDVLEHQAKDFDKADCVATKSALLETMKKDGIDKACVLHIATKEKQHEHLLSFATEINSDELISFGSVMPGSDYALPYIWKISDEGLKGIKFHPALQRCRPDEKSFFPMYDLARALNLIVVFHTGWDPSYPDDIDAPPESILNIAKNFPGLRIVAAHLGGMRMANEVLDTLCGKSDVYLDTAYAADMWCTKEQIEKMIRLHGAEKILFGSDYPWHDPIREMNLIDSLNIPNGDKELILGGNAARLLELD